MRLKSCLKMSLKLMLVQKHLFDNIMYSCHESDSIMFNSNPFDYVSVTKPSKKEVKHSVIHLIF